MHSALVGELETTRITAQPADSFFCGIVLQAAGYLPAALLAAAARNSALQELPETPLRLLVYNFSFMPIRPINKYGE